MRDDGVSGMTEMFHNLIWVITMQICKTYKKSQSRILKTFIIYPIKIIL